MALSIDSTTWGCYWLDCATLTVTADLVDTAVTLIAVWHHIETLACTGERGPCWAGNVFSFQRSAVYQERFPCHRRCTLFLKCPLFQVIGVFFHRSDQEPPRPWTFFVNRLKCEQRIVGIGLCAGGDTQGTLWAFGVTWLMELAKKALGFLGSLMWQAS